MTDLNDEVEEIELTYSEHKEFKGFGKYKNKMLKDNENRSNKLMEQCNKEFPTFVYHLLWVCACDNMMEELRIKNHNDEWEEVYKKSC